MKWKKFDDEMPENGSTITVYNEALNKIYDSYIDDRDLACFKGGNLQWAYKEMMRWVNADVHLPMHEDYKLVFRSLCTKKGCMAYHGKRFGIAFYDLSEYKWFDDNGYEIDKVSHWSELNAP